MEELTYLAKAPRLLMTVPLRPVQGERFQPTGFPNLGAATYSPPTGTPMLLVESPQSMANRLEAVCWDPARDDLVEELRGLPYVRVKLDDRGAFTSSVLEAHRLNSAYILGKGGDEEFKKRLREEMKLPAAKPSGSSKGKRAKVDSSSDVESESATAEADSSSDTAAESEEALQAIVNLREIATVVFRYDPGSLVHGVFLEKLGGRVRFTRALSACIEARNVRPVASGGVKLDRYAPKAPYKGASEDGFGNVPFPRTEYTAEAIALYVSLDLAQIRSYGLAEPAARLLTALALWKVQRFLDGGLRLRTACDLEVAALPHIARPAGFDLPGIEALTEQVQRAIRGCESAGLFAPPPVTELTFGGFVKAATPAKKGSDET